ncbi:MAG TPA: hypothetical protein VK609_09525 [Mucilaginibacter sp.]|nr:hypothetical protein [Mucilaginibacter sp.]
MKTQEITETEFRPLTDNVELLKKIARLLAGNINKIDDLSLTTGQAGFALFLNFYAKDESDDASKETGQLLLVSLYQQIVKSNIKAITDLLPGIGWMFAFLSNQNIIEIKQDEILKGIDSVILQHIHYQFSRTLNSGGVLSKGSYLLERYKGANDELKKIQIIEGIASIVDELQFNYSKVILNKVFIGTGNNNPDRVATITKISNLSKVIYFLNQVYQLKIYNHAVGKLTINCSNELVCLLKSVEPVSTGVNDTKEFSVLINAIHALRGNKTGHDIASLTNWLIKLLKQCERYITTLETSPYTGDLLISVKLLQRMKDDYPGLDQNIQLLADKLSAIIVSSANQHKPGYINCPVGIPNLGINEGVSGVGLLLFEQLKQEPIPWLDILLLH